MKVRQLSVFLENKSGRLATVTGVLGENAVNIRALSIADTTDFGILRLIVDDPDRAWEVLKAHDFTVSVTEIIAVRMPDTPGGLAGILKQLDAQQLNIEYMYAFVGRSDGQAVVVFRVEELDRAITSLQQAGVRLLSASEVDQF